MVRKTLGYSKRLAMLEAACVWEDVVYNFARHVKTLRCEINIEASAGYNLLRQWQPG